MINFLDKTSTQKGTPLNRANLMAMQGFEAKTTVFNSDGSITETNSKGETKTTTFLSNGEILEVFGNLGKRTTFNSDNSITEVVS